MKYKSSVTRKKLMKEIMHTINNFSNIIVMAFKETKITLRHVFYKISTS